MDARYAGALKAFLSHNSEEQPISPGAPDPLRDRMPERTTMPGNKPASRPPAGTANGMDLLPLIFAQMAGERSYRVKP